MDEVESIRIDVNCDAVQAKKKDLQSEYKGFLRPSS